ncbi:helix-turn-helix domain-containing protein [Marinoscillum pacificum]|uniref:helix-turn-helix domain-containing protein n=1 Tax=Marinoscillum pacificum TaxID=392723 RepID=UPI0021573876|nr:helix-turn-helix domain-containing protein [Marinoscillum pacificum]
MNTDRDIQISFLEWVKIKNPQLRFADELVTLLDISKDSAYRRMRGDTLLTFNEIRKISQHFNASLDTFFNLSKDTVLFHKRMLNVNFGYNEFLNAVLQSIQLIQRKESYHMTFIAKDIPPFHYFRFPELSAFKSYFWMKSILKEPTLSNKVFNRNVISPEMTRLCEEIWDAYQQVPSLEIWSDETFNVTLRQMEYSYEVGALTKVQLETLINELRQLLNLLAEEAEAGVKKSPCNKPVPNGRYELYYNEIEIGDNTIFFSMDEQRMVHKTYNMLNLLSTTDNEFCENIERYITTILQKSIPISNSSEKERMRFFNTMHSKLNEFERVTG